MSDSVTKLKTAIRTFTMQSMLGYVPTRRRQVKELADAATAVFGYDMTKDVTHEEHLEDLARTCTSCRQCMQNIPCGGCQQGSVCDGLCSCDDDPDSIPW